MFLSEKIRKQCLWTLASFVLIFFQSCQENSKSSKKDIETPQLMILSIQEMTISIMKIRFQIVLIFTIQFYQVGIQIQVYVLMEKIIFW